MTDEPRGTSLLVFAQRVGVQVEAVRKAIRTGRLERSVGRNARGQVVILDVDMALREWRDNADPAKLEASGRLVAAGNLGNGLEAPRDLLGIQEARRRELDARARRAELAIARQLGHVVDVAEVETRWATIAVTLRTRLLGISSRLKQERPDLSVADIEAVDRLVREALEELGAEG